METLLVKAYYSKLSYLSTDEKGVSLSYGVLIFHYVSFTATLNTLHNIMNKDIVLEASLLALLLPGLTMKP